MMVPEIYADGIGEISLSNGVIRIDLISLSPVQKDSKDPPLREVRQRVIMSPQGFIEAFGTMENVMKKLVDMGAIVKRPVDNPPQAQSQPVSPNFG